MIDAQEVAEQLDVSKGYAYRVIRMLNSELKDKGRIVVPGKVSRDYFEYRYFGLEKTPREM